MLKKIFAFFATLIIIVVLSLIFAFSGYCDEPVFKEDDPDAVTGHVSIQALVESTHSPDVTVELYPLSEDCNAHRYILTVENGYGLSDDIKTGEYECLCYTSTKNTIAEYGGGEVVVTQDKTAYVTAIAGSPAFANEYFWLSAYADENGNHPMGHVTAEDIDAIYRDSIRQQSGEIDGDVIGDDGDDDFTDPGQQTVDGEVQTPVPEDEHDGEETKTEFPTTAIVCAAVLLLIVSAALIIKKRREL